VVIIAICLEFIEMLDKLYRLGASRLEILRKVDLPRDMPNLFASLKVAITLAFIGSVVSETVGSNRHPGAVGRRTQRRSLRPACHYP
jgi:ABC-type nitrate/sulfonate/bicarbonate transport system permease component